MNDFDSTTETPLALVEGRDYLVIKPFKDMDGIQINEGERLYKAARSKDRWRFHNKEGTHIVALTSDYQARNFLGTLDQ